MKLLAARACNRACRSHPAGVRGLKLQQIPLRTLTLWSHPAGVRGLKHQRRMINPRQQRRTPQGCVG